VQRSLTPIARTTVKWGEAAYYRITSLVKWGEAAYYRITSLLDPHVGAARSAFGRAIPAAK